MLVVCSGASENHKCSRLFELPMSNNSKIIRLCRDDEISDALSPITRLKAAVNIVAVDRIHLYVSCSRKRWANVRKKLRTAKK
jgi:hypothetical protein